MADKRDFGEIHGQFPDPQKVQCKDCVFRDKTKLTLDGKTIYPGITKDYCEIYDRNTNGKGNGILFWGEKCKYYVKE